MRVRCEKIMNRFALTGIVGQRSSVVAVGVRVGHVAAAQSTLEQFMGRHRRRHSTVNRRIN